MKVNRRLCGRVKRKRSPSRPVRPVDDVPTTMLCGEIILAATPPEELVATVSTGLIPMDSAVTFCMLQKSAFAEVSLPVTKTPSQPKKADTKGKAAPVIVKARPSVVVMPDQLAT